MIDIDRLINGILPVVTLVVGIFLERWLHRRRSILVRTTDYKADAILIMASDPETTQSVPQDRTSHASIELAVALYSMGGEPVAVERTEFPQQPLARLEGGAIEGRE